MLSFRLTKEVITTNKVIKNYRWYYRWVYRQKLMKIVLKLKQIYHY
jgi:hypothetical protein